MKYSGFNKLDNDKLIHTIECELPQAKVDIGIGNMVFEVYQNDYLQCGMTLVTKDYEVSRRELQAEPMTVAEAEDWIEQWHAVARIQYMDLGDQIHELHKQQDLIMHLISLER